MDKNELRLASAIMAAAAEGRMIHHRSRRGGDWVETNPTQAKWNWGINEYMAEGVEMRTLLTTHDSGSALFGDSANRSDWSNPDHLTGEQVGVAEGWRLLTMGEVGYDENGSHRENRADCQMWSGDGVWSQTILFCPTTGQTFRTLSPLPQTTSQVHLDGTRAHESLQSDSVPRFNWTGEQWQAQDPRPIQNPAGVTQEQLQPELGWRFCLQSEMDLMPQDAEHWHSGEWGTSGYAGRSNTDHNREYGSYRTRTPLPPNQTTAQWLEDAYRELTSPDHAPLGGTCSHESIEIPMQANPNYEDAEEDDIGF